jgi:hypothetical protein
MLANGDHLMIERPLNVRSPKRFRASTLMTLLAVISIVAVLMAILLPAWRKARESSELAKSQSNVKQIAITELNYTQDFKNLWITTNWPLVGMDYAGDGAFNDSDKIVSYLDFMVHFGIPHPIWWQTVPPSKTSDQAPGV